MESDYIKNAKAIMAGHEEYVAGLEDDVDELEARIEILTKALRQVQAMYIEDEYEPVRICRQWVEPVLELPN